MGMLPEYQEALIHRAVEINQRFQLPSTLRLAQLWLFAK